MSEFYQWLKKQPLVVIGYWGDCKRCNLHAIAAMYVGNLAEREYALKGEFEGNVLYPLSLIGMAANDWILEDVGFKHFSPSNYDKFISASLSSIIRELNLVCCPHVTGWVYGQELTDSDFSNAMPSTSMD